MFNYSLYIILIGIYCSNFNAIVTCMNKYIIVIIVIIMLIILSKTI